MISLNASISVNGFIEKCAKMSHFWVMCFFLIKLSSQIREMSIGIICIIGQMRILDGWELCHFNIRGPLIVGAANFLQIVLPQVMEDMPLHVRMNMWMQHDSAPPYYALCPRQVMNGIFDEKWIGRDGPVAWPPCSPDLTSPDYFWWGFVEERVMAVAPTTPDDMKERIRRASTKITPQLW